MNFELIKTGRHLALILTVGLYFPLVGQALKKDTTFLFKDTVDGELQTIFIDPNPNSAAYEEISNFSFDYFDQLKAAKKDQPATKSVLPWTNWVTLKQYKGNFYLYRPCDFLYHFRQSFYDSTIVNWYGKGPFIFKILTQKKRNSKTYEFKIRGIELVRKLTVHILDKKIGIALFEQTNTSHAGIRWTLMIAADKIKSVPIIVNHCPTQKQSELEFDEVDVSKLLEMK